MKLKLSSLLLLFWLIPSYGQQLIKPGALWLDTQGKPINAHGGGILNHEGTYYWYGEHRAPKGGAKETAVNCYSSTNLHDWKYEGRAISTVDEQNHPLTHGSIIERPKVIYNQETKKFVLYFHHELKGKGYGAAHHAVAISDKPTGPFELIRSGRVNANHWPMNLDSKFKEKVWKSESIEKWWTPNWYKAVEEGLFVQRDLENGQMARDCTLYVDDNGKAYHIYSAEENLTLHIAELSDDYLSHTGKYIRIAPGGHNEAPALFKHKGTYYMITSGCTGWDPNPARLLVAKDIMGPWKELANPCKGELAELTFKSQGTYILPIQGENGAYIFMADRWNKHDLYDSRYIWLPIQFEDGLPTLRWREEWSIEAW